MIKHISGSYYEIFKFSHQNMLTFDYCENHTLAYDPASQLVYTNICIFYYLGFYDNCTLYKTNQYQAVLLKN